MAYLLSILRNSTVCDRLLLADSSRWPSGSSDARIVELDLSIDVPEQVVCGSVKIKLDVLQSLQVREPVGHGQL